MKFCEKCGKEIMDEAVICPGCGCAVVQKTQVKQVSYDDCVKGAATTNIISGIVLALGVFCALFVNAWLGVVLCLAAELIALAPNSKWQKLFKKNNIIADKKEFKNKAKQCQKELKLKCTAFKFSFVLAYISLACLIVFVLWANAIGL